MDLDPEVSASSVGVALTGLNAALAQVIDVVEGGGLDELGVMGFIDTVRGFERVRNRMALVDHRIVTDCESRQIADELNLRNTRALLVDTLRLSPLEAGRRVRAAAAVGARTTMLGEPLEPLRPILAGTQRAGEMTPEQVAAIEESLRDMERLDAAPEKVSQAEEILAEYAHAFEPRELRRTGEKLADVAVPDGPAPDDAALQLKRRLQMATGHDGAIRGKFCLTPDVGAALAAVLSPLAKPRKDPPVDGGHIADAHRDSRTSEQRLHDALGDLCSWALRGGGLVAPANTAPTSTDVPSDQTNTQTAADEHADQQTGSDRACADQAREDSSVADQTEPNQTDPGVGEASSAATDGGFHAAPPQARPGPPAAPATVIVTIDINDLINRTGKGETSLGAFLSPEQILRLAAEAEIYPVVLTATGIPLSLGRTRRIATRAQSMALIARDGGCSFPGCDHPPEWCDRHHVIAWVDGGLTDLDNLTLLCRYHHTRFLGKGWTCRMNADGLPEWIPPRWQDPDQAPLLNVRILRRQLQRRIERSRTRQLVDPGRRWTAASRIPTSSPRAETTGPTTAGPAVEKPTWLDVVAADLRRAQIARESVLSAAAEERGRRLGALWCPDEDEDLSAGSWTREEIWEAGWRPADPHPERLDPWIE